MTEGRDTGSRLDISISLWHTMHIVAQATTETSRRPVVVQRVRVGCEPDTRTPPKILPEPPTEMAADAAPE